MEGVNTRKVSRKLPCQINSFMLETGKGAAVLFPSRALGTGTLAQALIKAGHV